MNHPFTFTAPTDKMPGAWHGAYLPVYAKLFAPLKQSEGSVLECGVDGGGSLLMYATYFTNARKVIGMDISPCPEAIRLRKVEPDGDRFQFVQGDAYSPQGRLPSWLGPFVLMVDDGSHHLGHQIAFCEHYPRLLLPDGIAIVEDVQSVDCFKALSAALPPEFFGYGIDLRHHDNRYDNLLFVITRR